MTERGLEKDGTNGEYWLLLVYQLLSYTNETEKISTFHYRCNNYKGYFPDEGSPEQLALRLLDLSVHHWVQLVHLSASLHGCQHVVFCGSLVSHPLVRARLQHYMDITCVGQINMDYTGA